MAYEVTATRKRPQQFEAVAGQEFVISTITNAIAQNRIAHAYLFSGPRGVGKTTTARLLAKAINCENGPTGHPCGTCSNCIEITKGCSPDVIEIDGASNTSVNDVRNIKDEISFPPQSSRYKIYIIDEVHMLSNSAFNALLKTIEEPPEYVVFIFATTETQKVPATIRSRCQQFNFQLLNIETIKRLLKEACDETGVKAEDQALFWIAKESTGAMRDAYTLLDQVVSFSNGEITLEKIRTKLGLAGIDSLNEIMQSVLKGKKATAMEQLQTLLQRGVSVEQCIRDMADYFRALLLIRKGITSESVLGEQVEAFPKEVREAYSEEQLETGLSMFLGLYRDIRYSLNPRFELELAISRMNTLRYMASNTVIMEQLTRLKNDMLQGKLSPTNPQLRRLPDLDPDNIPSDKSHASPHEASGESEEAQSDNDIILEQKESSSGKPEIAAPGFSEMRRQQQEESPLPQSSLNQPELEEDILSKESFGKAAPEEFPHPLSGIGKPELDRLVKFSGDNDPSMFLIMKQVRTLHSENNVVYIDFSSEFALRNAENNIKGLKELFKRELSFTGELVLRASAAEANGTVRHEEAQAKDPTENLIETMFGGTRE